MTMPAARHQHGDGAVTTLMFRTVPRRFTVTALAIELESYIPKEAFNFVYLPGDRKSASSVRYAFVNFVDAAAASAVQATMDGKCWRLLQGGRPICIVPAHIQGIAQNLIRLLDGPELVEPETSLLVTSSGNRLDLQTALEVYCRTHRASDPIRAQKKGGAGRTGKGWQVPVAPSKARASQASPSRHQALNILGIPDQGAARDQAGGWGSRGSSRTTATGGSTSDPLASWASSSASGTSSEANDLGPARQEQEALEEPEHVGRSAAAGQHETQATMGLETLLQTHSYHSAWQGLNLQLQELQSCLATPLAMQVYKL